jgi:hypothetical protein
MPSEDVDVCWPSRRIDPRSSTISEIAGALSDIKDRLGRVVGASWAIGSGLPGRGLLNLNSRAGLNIFKVPSGPVTTNVFPLSFQQAPQKLLYKYWPRQIAHNRLTEQFVD